MDIGERRKRRRKSQSFKLVTDEEFGPSYVTHSSSKDANGEQDAAVPDVWLGDDSMEIKRQITGMMWLLGDRTGRVYQRAEKERDSSSTTDNTTRRQSAPSTPLQSGPTCGTLSKDPRTVNNTQDVFKVDDAPVTNHTDAVPEPVAPGPPRCMCNCEGTLRAILRELRAMRRLMQTRRVSYTRTTAYCWASKTTGVDIRIDCEVTVSSASPQQPCQPRLGPVLAANHRPRKRRSVLKAARKAAPSPAATTPLTGEPAEAAKEEDSGNPFLLPDDSSESSVRQTQSNAGSANSTRPTKALQAIDIQSEVRLAEDYDVFISKAQLESILVNYTRSGSLLFRKLVCAFFDDATLANSLPNGRRKRGVNDNRKGLDQNIVGAIKVFTEKYCSEHRIEKLPGPRDWVQILQDQIKLARRRLKRDAAQEAVNGPSSSATSACQQEWERH
ncbi:BEN domain-containing protein 7 [Phycodurus eques]|uniref:BEN domain-containing protein 7 n=1 Tax=Phycodurus eques TaxID=693459 RepID=UPI002ACE3744|nr:BEN domain-containing protein 7 [Phycodurus eques]